MGTTAENVQPSALNVAQRGGAFVSVPDGPRRSATRANAGFPPIGNKGPAPNRPRNVTFTSSAARIWIVERIVKETLALCQPDLDRIHAGARSLLASNLPPVMVDVLQVEQALYRVDYELAQEMASALGRLGRPGGTMP